MEDEGGNLHCVVIACRGQDGGNRVLVSRHFDGASSDRQVAWEGTMYEAAARDLDAAGEGSEAPMACTIRERVCVFCRLNDLLIMVAGGGMVDELLLLDVLRAVTGVLSLLAAKSGPSAAVVIEHYAKVALAVDEVSCAGSIELLDAARILSMVSLKWDKDKHSREAAKRDSGGSAGPSPSLGPTPASVPEGGGGVKL